MKICVVGAGGVGGYFGGRMAEAGHDVTFVARGKHLEAIKAEGLKVNSIDGDFLIIPAKAEENPKAIFDLVIVTIKVWQISALGNLLKDIVGDNTVVLPLENGIESVELLQQFVKPNQILGGLCRIFSWIESPGIITHGSYKPSITFGELDNSVSDRVKAIAALFDSCKFDYVIAEDIEKEVWIKFLFIASSSVVGALTRAPYGIYRTIPETRKLLLDILDEMVEVGIAKGVNVSKKMVQQTMDFIDKMPADATTSMQRDIMEGKPSELDAQLGAVLRLADVLMLRIDKCKTAYAALLPQEKLARGEV